MTNKEMVLAPRELLEQILSSCTFTLSGKQHEELRALLAAPPCVFHDDRKDECETYSGDVPCATAADAELDKLKDELRMWKLRAGARLKQRDRALAGRTAAERAYILNGSTRRGTTKPADCRDHIYHLGECVTCGAISPTE